MTDEPGIDQQRQSGSRVQKRKQPEQLDALSLGRHDFHPIGEVRGCVHQARHRGEAVTSHKAGSPYHPERIVGERNLRIQRSPQQPGLEVGATAVRVVEDPVGDVDRHGVHGEVTP